MLLQTEPALLRELCHAANQLVSRSHVGRGSSPAFAKPGNIPIECGKSQIGFRRKQVNETGHSLPLPYPEDESIIPEFRAFFNCGLPGRCAQQDRVPGKRPFSGVGARYLFCARKSTGAAKCLDKNNVQSYNKECY